MARFNFVGEIEINDKPDAKRPWIKNGKTGTGANYKTLNLSVAQTKNCKAFVECFAMEQSVIKTYDTENSEIEISVKDRNDADVISSVANYRKKIVDLGDGDRHEFIYDLDFVEFIESHIAEIKGKRFMITGQVSKNVYNGTISDRFQIQNIYAVADDVKSKLQVSLDETWTTEDLDLANWKDEKKIYLNGKTLAYIDKKTLGEAKGANRYVAQQLVLDCSKLDYSNEKHMQLLDFKLKQLGLKRDGEKITTTLKKNKIYALGINCAYFSGNQEVDFDESTLTPNQKMAIELGLNKLSDFAPAGGIYGERIVEYKIQNFNLRDKAENGCYDTELTSDEYEELWFTPVQEEKLEEVLGKVEEASKSDDLSDLDDLFG